MPVAAKSRIKPKTKTAHSIVFESENPKMRNESGQQTILIPTVHTSQIPEKRWEKPAPWWTNGLKFPCGLPNHDHEVSTCAEFFSMTPGDRGDYIPRSKVC